jgi:hypothetical protein
MTSCDKTSKNEIYYPTDFRIQYNNDKEYRAVIRKLFKMTSNIVALSQSDQDEDIDEITRDEWDYDQESITHLFDFIYSATEKEPIFDEMYKKAAGFMLSEDPSIGLAVLFSYDYLMFFHPVLCDYFRFIQGGSLFNSAIPSIIHLHQKITR